MSKAPAAGAPAWMVTFADLMALLLCLFVLLLSFADMEAQKFKTLAGSMREAFGSSRVTKLMGVIEKQGSILREQAVQVVEVPLPQSAAEEQEKKKEEDKPEQGDAAEKPQQEKEDIQSLRFFEKVMAEEIAMKSVEVFEADDRVIIRFPEKTSFAAGSDRVSDFMLPTVAKLALVLIKTQGKVIISGHTDNVPIHTARFRSNWDLSAARAASVVHELTKVQGLDTSRITVQGLADSQPIAANDTPDNRALNRRVEISIEKREGGPAKKPVSDTGSGKAVQPQGGTPMGETPTREKLPGELPPGSKPVEDNAASKIISGEIPSGAVVREVAPRIKIPEGKP